MKFVGKLE